MEFFEWRNLCEGDRYLNLTEFLKRHADHEIIVIEEVIHGGSADPSDLKRLFGANASVEYLGKDSLHWSDNDGLYFEITPEPKKKRRQPIHVVVYPN